MQGRKEAEVPTGDQLPREIQPQEDPKQRTGLKSELECMESPGTLNRRPEHGLGCGVRAAHSYQKPGQGRAGATQPGV